MTIPPIFYEPQILHHVAFGDLTPHNGSGQKLPEAAYGILPIDFRRVMRSVVRSP